MQLCSALQKTSETSRGCSSACTGGSNLARGCNLCSDIKPIQSCSYGIPIWEQYWYSAKTAAVAFEIMFLVHDHPLFHFKCATLGHALSQEETVGNSINVHFEIQHSQISAAPRSARRHGHLVCMRMHVCALKNGQCAWSANHSRFFPGAQADELGNMTEECCFSSLQLAFKRNESRDDHDFTPSLFTGTPPNLWIERLPLAEGKGQREAAQQVWQLGLSADASDLSGLSVPGRSGRSATHRTCPTKQVWHESESKKTPQNVDFH